MIITLHVIFLSPSCFFFHRQCDKLLETFGSIVNSFDHKTDICIGHRESKKKTQFIPDCTRIKNFGFEIEK